MERQSMLILSHTSLLGKSIRALSSELQAQVICTKKKPTPIYHYGDQKDKLYQYKFFLANNIPGLEFTTDKTIALEWLFDGRVVVGRRLLNSSEGKGIVVYNTYDELNSDTSPCKVYTRYALKKKEFRVHVFKDQVVDVLEKRKKKGVTSVDAKIRNTANGYVFCRQSVVEPEGIRKLALRARTVTASDFVGVDIGFNEKLNKLFVIEVNSAPGMEGTTIKNYVKAIVNHDHI